MRIEYHRTLIADAARNAAFYKALQAVIVPGKSIVADIGAGTGLLGLMASKLGAREVFLFESAAVADVAGAVLKANGARNCHVIPCHSTEFTDAIAADVIVSETLGNYAFEENIIETLNDARARFLKRGGVIIPRRVRQFASPVVSDRIHKELSVWRTAGPAVGLELDLWVAEAMSFNNVYVRSISQSELLDAGRAALAWDDVDLARKQSSSRNGDVVWTAHRPETVYGLAVWWTVELADGIAISTAPDAPASHWEQLYFPFQLPIALAAGDSVRAILRSRSSEEAGTHLAWTVMHLAPDGAVISKARHDLDKGYLP